MYVKQHTSCDRCLSFLYMSKKELIDLSLKIFGLYLSHYWELRFLVNFMSLLNPVQ